MARLIKETPILFGSDAIRFEERMANPPKLSPEKRAEIRKARPHRVRSREPFKSRRNIMQAKNDIGSFDKILDEKYGAIGTPEREAFHREAYAYCMGQMVMEARKQEKMSQTELAARVGTNKTYISRIERGLIEPGIGVFCQIANALGMKLELVKAL